MVEGRLRAKIFCMNKNSFITAHAAALDGLPACLRNDQALVESLIVAGIGWGDLHSSGFAFCSKQDFMLTSAERELVRVALIPVGALFSPFRLLCKFGPDFLPVIREKFLTRHDAALMRNRCKPEQLVVWYAVVRLPLRDRGRLDACEFSDSESAAELFNEFLCFHAA